MCGCRSPLRRACPPPHIEKAFDLRWYKVTRRPRRGTARGCPIPLHPDPLPPWEGGRGCREWGDGRRDILSAPALWGGCAGGGASPQRGLAPPKKKVYPGKWYNPSHPAL